ncbi:hypothetical protein RHGRI_033683 [Rhododendron griersonianum]|uniref:Uncharacterized protein n=1 Tax=Rhododendron griersonianum TaxID=479676 RepID=A0AAV6HY40_9ERIC|nr:hypothetical protein RHGRI_033683 [Rhododendron griersonianum]
MERGGVVAVATTKISGSIPVDASVATPIPLPPPHFGILEMPLLLPHLMLIESLSLPLLREMDCPCRNTRLTNRTNRGTEVRGRDSATPTFDPITSADPVDPKALVDQLPEIFGNSVAPVGSVDQQNCQRFLNVDDQLELLGQLDALTFVGSIGSTITSVLTGSTKVLAWHDHGHVLKERPDRDHEL